MLRLKRFYIESEFTDELILHDETHHHIKNVLRAKPGEMFVFLNDFEKAVYRFEKYYSKSSYFSLIEKSSIAIPEYKLAVYLALLQREYLDDTVEKLGELGVTDFIPVITKRSIQSLKDNTIRRIETLICKGALQAELDFFPKVHSQVHVADVPILCEESILFSERKEVKSDIIIKGRSVGIFIGPEGGMEDYEISSLVEKGFMEMSPLPNILKSATASVVFAGCIRTKLYNIIL